MDYFNLALLSAVLILNTRISQKLDEILRRMGN